MHDWLSTAQFARARRISGQRVRQLLAAGRVPGARRIGERWAIPASAQVRRGAPGRPATTRAGVLRQAARACEAALSAAAVRSAVVGSLAYGGVHPSSDLDVLVLSHPGMTWAQVDAIATQAVRPFGVPVDLIFAETLPASVKAAMRKDARRARDL